MTDRRVVITGLGAVTPLGADVATFWKRSLAGESGIAPIEHFDCSAYPVRFAGYCRDFDPDSVLERREFKRLDRFCHLAVGAADEALRDAGLEGGSVPDKTRAGIVCGSGIGGVDEIYEQCERLIARGPKRVSPHFVPKMMGNAASGHLAARYGFMGPNVATTSACATSSHAIATAAAFLRAGYADLFLAGGAEAAVGHLGLAGFCAARALSTRNDDPQRASRPFDKDRDGFVLGEGAGLVVLETLEHAQARGARILAEVKGAGMSDDAHHVTAPHPEGAGAALAMRAALREAGLAPEAIDLVNAHGTSTLLGDVAETAAIKLVLGEHAKKIVVNATKSQIGHLLGAAGVLGVIACVLAIRDGVVSPTINLETPDPACDLDYIPNQARELTVRAALTNSFGFGGHNVCLAVTAMD